ncbi:MAG: Crp/Fnr family transcriptional regulator [Candidatus Dormibacteraeota bacterium]|nr:Crp/Fnr family transcriptional regulator [Candidatus Dormibacteraeota bacterium]
MPPAADVIQLLAKARLFEGVTAAELEALRPAVRMRTFPKDSHVFREGDPGSHLYLVKSGQVKIVKVSEGGGEIVFAIVGAGEVFGELSLFEPEGERSAGAIALEPTECALLARDPVHAFLLRHPTLLLRMISSLVGYIQRKDRAMAEVAFLDIPGRVAQRLVDLAESRGERMGEGVVIRIPLSQRTLAGMVGASRENVNRALQRFVELGYISHARGTITVLKPDELRKRASR